MKWPWTIDTDWVAEHALPLAHWINHMLWRWSPWHIRFQLRVMQERADFWRGSYEQEKRTADSYRRFIGKTNRVPSFRFSPKVDVRLFPGDATEFSGLRVCLPERMLVLWLDPDHLAAILECPPVMEGIAEDVAQTISGRVKGAVLSALLQQ